jgi:hypothetical protein
MQASDLPLPSLAVAVIVTVPVPFVTLHVTLLSSAMAGSTVALICNVAVFTTVSLVLVTATLLTDNGMMAIVLLP